MEVGAVNIHIRCAVLADHAAVAAIMAQVQRLHVQWRPDVYRPNDDLFPVERLEELIAREAIYVAECDGQVAGVMEIVYRHIESPAHVTRNVVFVDTMAVEEAFRRQGIGKAFFRFLIELKAEKQLDGIELQVNARNLQAKKLYEAYGFTEKSINMELL